MKNHKSKNLKRILDESDDSEPEEKVRKINNGARRSTTNRRSSTRNSRRNSPEPAAERSSRRSSKKFTPEVTSDRRTSKRSLDLFNMGNLETLINDIIKHEASWPFNKPVSITEVPDYFEVIKQPMDFSKIKSKLNVGTYQTNQQMMKDVELVFFNCDLYNMSNSEIYK